MKKTFLLVYCTLFMAASCAPFPKSALEQVDVTAPFQEVQKGPGRFLNKNVMWGGVIIDTLVRKDGTDIKVLEKGLDIEKRPVEGDVTYGRFIVRYPVFLDPAIYKPGRELTVIGTITGSEVEPIGQMQYSYPVIEAKHTKLWETRAKYRRPVYWDYPFMPFPYGGYPYLYNRPPFWD